MDQKDQIAGQVVKKKRADLAKFGEEYVTPGQNKRYLRMARVAMDLPPIDISDPKQVEERMNRYFDYCEEHDRKPSFVGLANWLGVCRDTLNSWKRGEYRKETHSDLIEKAVTLFEELMVDYLQNGLVNPASGIFLAKNMFGYRDVQDVTIRPDAPLGEEPNQKQLEERIAGTVVIDED